jgi:hypothetical protein
MSIVVSIRQQYNEMVFPNHIPSVLHGVWPVGDGSLWPTDGNSLLSATLHDDLLFFCECWIIGKIMAFEAKAKNI